MKTLFYGDNLEILPSLPAESVDLCYIDPPFNSQQDYNQIYSTAQRKDQAQAQAFVDTWEWNVAAQEGYDQILGNAGGLFRTETIDLFRGLRSVLKQDSELAYLVSITLRVAEIHRILKSTGSFYLHCDPSASHGLKLVLDSIFGKDNFQNEVIWKRTSGHNSAKRWGPVHDVLFFYSKTKKYTWNRVSQGYEEAYLEKFYRHEDEGGKYQLGDLTGAGIRKGDSGQPWQQIDPTKTGRHWAVPAVPGKSAEENRAMSVQAKLDALQELGLIRWPSKGTIPRFKRYLDIDKGVAIQDVITDIDPLSPHSRERMGYPTQKPEALLERIIRASTNEGDVVLDAYCGCGTTIAVAENLKRQWIGIDITYQSISLILKRIEEKFGSSILETVKTAGIPKDLAAAEALALREDDRTRKEFEKWAILTYTNNRAVIHQRKGSDQGIDGAVYFFTGKGETEKMVFQVKPGDVQRGDIAKLKGDMEREGAAMATLLTLREPTQPTQPMREEAARSGIYHHALTGMSLSRIQIVTIREMLDEKARLSLPMTAEVLKKAQAVSRFDQASLGLEDE